MIVYRLAKRQYAQDLSGKGAELVGGRWNSKGNPLLYTSQSIALCTAEVAVHIPLGIIPKDYMLIHIEIPKDSIKDLKTKDLPKDWKSFPHVASTQKIGDLFINNNKYLVLKVPSVVVQGEYNYLINTRHKMFDKVKIKKTEPFTFDSRLFT